MASFFTDTYVHAMLNWVLRNVSTGTSPASANSGLYLALFSVMPSSAGSGATEVTTSFRAAGRLLIPISDLAAASGRKVVLTVAKNLGLPASGGITAVGAGLFDASTNGNLVCAANLLQGSVVSDLARETVLEANTVEFDFPTS